MSRDILLFVNGEAYTEAQHTAMAIRSWRAVPPRSICLFLAIPNVAGTGESDQCTRTNEA